MQSDTPNATGLRPSRQDEPLADLLALRSKDDAERIRRAWRMASPKGTLEAGGTPDMPTLDPPQVARILHELNLDADTIAAALLHGAVTGGRVTPADVSEAFGGEVARLVEGVARMDRIRELRQRGLDQAGDQARMEGLRKLLLAMAEDLRVVLVKLAERVHEMRLLTRHPDDAYRRAVAEETLDIHTPLANRLGIWQVKWELEDLAFRFMDPERYQEIAGHLDERRQDREQFIESVVRDLRARLKAEGIDADVTGRPKHIYSIWRKMRRKGLGFHELFDVRALRVLTASVGDCYAALGVVHGLWQHIPKEFDDYITNPKGNNYQSLHTAVVGPGGRTLEVQIRTREMHRHAELGVAAHWRYKEGGRQDRGYEDRIAWLRQLLEPRDGPADSGDFLEGFKTEVFHDRVYALSPRGQVVDLPRGATPLDFAYAIHSEVGNRCRGAKVDGAIVPLTYELRNGDQVEVLTARNGTPGRDWLNPDLGYLKTSRARAKARQWFKQQDYDKNLSSGRDLLERELRRLGVSDVNLNRLAKRLRFNQLDDMLAALGRGEVGSVQIAGAVREQVLPQAEARPPEAPRPRNRPVAGASGDVIVDGVGNLLSHTAKCCKPAPPEAIVGYITRGQGVTIHRRDCPNVLRLGMEDRTRLIDVSWGSAVTGSYPVDIDIQAYDRQGLLRDITLLLANAKVNLLGVNTHTDRTSSIAHMSFTVEVPDVSTLSRVLNRLAQLPNVVEVRRRK